MNTSDAPPESAPTSPVSDGAHEAFARLRSLLNGVLFGQESFVNEVLTGLLAGGHLLIEGLPGLGKTALVRALATATGLESRRIQFTPDLLPGDITGNPVLQESAGQRRFVFEPGPVFCNLLLADEINRASPKTQSALLEAMQEGRVTSFGETYDLPSPFSVLATQNPVELEGTYPLPEAQLDRFLFKILVPTVGADVLERIVLEREHGAEAPVEPVMTPVEYAASCRAARAVFMPPAVANFIARLVASTHAPPGAEAGAVKFGASPRAALALAAAARARALLDGRSNAGFDDVRSCARPVLRHRIVLDYTARLEGVTPGALIERLVTSTPVQPQPLAPNLEAVRS